MLRSDQIRGWRWVGLCCVLCLAWQGFAFAQAETSIPATTQAQPSTASTAAAKPAASGHATTKHTPSHTSSRASAKSKNVHGKKVAKKRGQQAIDSTRARQIQTALIR